MYLDNAATSKPNSLILDEILPYITEYYHNPSAIYSDGIKVRNDIENVRCKIANYINCNSDEIYFTSGGTESNNWVIQGFIKRCRVDNVKPIIITSNIEHKSILKCVNNMKVEVIHLEVDKEGYVNVRDLELALKLFDNKTTRVLVSIQYANNEIGTIQHIKTLCEITHKYNAIFHTDAVQAFGNIPIDVEDLGIDLLSASGHKIGALKGIGFLYNKNDIIIEPLIYGEQERKLRGGTENVVGIISLGKAIELYNDTSENVIRCRNYMIDELITKTKAKLNGSFIYRLPNNINITLRQDINNESFIHFLETYNIQIASGSACNSNSIKKSHVLKAIGLSDENIDKTLRITLPHDITLEDTKIITNVIIECINCFQEIVNF